MGKDEAEAYKKAGNINSEQTPCFRRTIWLFCDKVNIWHLKPRFGFIILGNKLFAEHRYEDAIKEYSTAIVSFSFPYKKEIK